MYLYLHHPIEIFENFAGKIRLMQRWKVYEFVFESSLTTVYICTHFYIAHFNIVHHMHIMGTQVCMTKIAVD